MPPPGQATQIFGRLLQGDRAAFDELLPLVYEELRALGQRHLRRERPDHTLQATALAHEAYLRLVGQSTLAVSDRAHFFAVAARAMRQILIEHARARGRHKRGGGWDRVRLDSVEIAGEEPRLDVLDLDRALSRLAAEDPRKAQVVELLHFGGLTAAEAAEVIGVTSRTVERDWRVARLRLLRELVDPERAE
ncbi:MAG: sigma-70 family RNA polymerase sigma factor [bacterium]